MNLYRMSKQQELDGEALPAKEGFPKSQSSLLLNSIPSLPPSSLSPHPFPISPVENHPLMLVNPSGAWDPGKLDSVQMLCRHTAVFTFLMDLESVWGHERLEPLLTRWDSHRLLQLEVGSLSRAFLTLLGLAWGVGGAGPSPLFPDPWLTLWPGCGGDKKKKAASLPHSSQTQPGNIQALWYWAQLCSNLSTSSRILQPAVGAWKWLPAAVSVRWAMPSPHQGTGGRTGSQNAVRVSLLPRHGSGPPVGSWEIWGFLPAHLWCWDLTWTHAAS